MKFKSEKSKADVNQLSAGRKKTRKKLKNSLRYTISMRISLTFLIVIVLLIATAVGMAGNTIRKETRQGLVDISRKNALEITNVTASAISIATPLEAGLDQVASQAVTADDSNRTIPSEVMEGRMLNMAEERAESVLSASLFSYFRQEKQAYNSAGIYLTSDFPSQGLKDYGMIVSKDSVQSKKANEITGDVVKKSDFANKALKSGKITFSNPYKSPYSKQKTVTGAIPVKMSPDGSVGKGDQVIGLVLVDLNADAFKIDSKGSSYSSMLLDVINNNGVEVYSSFADSIGKRFDSFFDKTTAESINSELKIGKEFITQTNSAGYHKVRAFNPVKVGDEIWWVQTSINYDEYVKSEKTVGVFMSALALVAILLIFFLISRLLKRTLQPLSEVAGVAETMAKGSFDISMTYKKDDEIGRLRDSMQNMVDRLRKIIEDLQNKLDRIADGDLVTEEEISSEEEQIYIGEYRPMLESIRMITLGLNATMNEIQNSADQVAGGAGQVASGAQALAQGSTEQASSVEELSTTMSNISVKINETAKRAEEASSLSLEAGKAVALSNEKMEEMSAAMSDITNKAEEINKIIKTIDDIAFQTNILALNASIEAARAGAAGKGFAVVADEVGNLANKSAQAAQSTAALIQDTVRSVSNGDEITRETAESLQSVSTDTNKVIELINEITTASKEQSTGVGQITKGLDQISAVVQTNSATAEESAAAAEELSAQAENMQAMVGTFKLTKDADEGADQNVDQNPASDDLTDPAVTNVSETMAATAALDDTAVTNASDAMAVPDALDDPAVTNVSDTRDLTDGMGGYNPDDPKMKTDANSGKGLDGSVDANADAAQNSDAGAANWSFSDDKY